MAAQAKKAERIRICKLQSDRFRGKISKAGPVGGAVCNYKDSCNFNIRMYVLNCYCVYIILYA